MLPLRAFLPEMRVPMSSSEASDALLRFVAGQPAARVNRALRQALAAADLAQECAILWFAEVARRSLFRELGYVSLEAYAFEALGFSRNRFFQFKGLADALERLPRLREAVACGRIGWTKAQQVARVATPSSEQAWVDRATTTARRDFAEAVKTARARARENRRRMAAFGFDQLDLPMGPGAAGQSDTHEVGVSAAGGEVTGEPQGGAAIGGPPSAAPGQTSSGGVPVQFVAGVAARLAAADEKAGAGRTTGGGIAGVAGLAAADEKAGAGRTTGGGIAGVAGSNEGGGACGQPIAIALAADPPTTVCFRLDGLQAARFEALIERIRKRQVVPRRAGREEILLAALEALAESAPVAAPARRGEGDASRGVECANQKLQPTENMNVGELRRRNSNAERGSVGAPCTGAEPDPGPARGSLPPVQIVVKRCPDCARAAAVTRRGDRRLTRAEAEAVDCDARIHAEGQRSRATTPPAVRAAVLARDGHRCRAPGCGATRFLEVHHIVSRGGGGSNRAENLITLCSRCHRFAHEWTGGEVAAAVQLARDFGPAGVTRTGPRR